MEIYINNLDIEDELKVLLLALYKDCSKEQIDELVKFAEVNSNNTVTLNEKDYIILNEYQAYTYVEDRLNDYIEELRYAAGKGYDWLIDYINTNTIPHDIYDWEPEVAEQLLGNEYYYFWEI